MMRLTKTLLLLLLIANSAPLARAEEDEPAKGTKKTIEAPSPDGQFAFRYTVDADAERKTYDLIRRKSGKVLARVADSEPDIGPSGRFNMHVLWRADSQAFALTATLWKRGSSLDVYVRDGDAFHKVMLPELVAEIPEKLKGDKSFPHIVELNSQTAKRWKKDGSLVAEIETIQDGEGPTATVTRTVVLDVEHSRKARVVHSSTKASVDTQ